MGKNGDFENAEKILPKEILGHNEKILELQ